MNYLVLLLSNCFLTYTFFTDTENIKYQDNRKDGIELIISNIRNKKGIIRIGMYKSEKGYPDNPEVSFSLAKDTIVSGTLRSFIPVKDPGSFGFSILDDENENGKMDYRLGIIPKEGFGFSNNPRVARKAPPFERTSFKFTGGKKQITVRMVYI